VRNRNWGKDKKTQHGWAVKRLEMTRAGHGQGGSTRNEKQGRRVVKDSPHEKCKISCRELGGSPGPKKPSKRTGAEEKPEEPGS